MTCNLVWIFELWIHEWLRKGNSIPLLPLCGHRPEADSVCSDHDTTKEGENQQYLWLSEPREYLLYKGTGGSGVNRCLEGVDRRSSATKIIESRLERIAVTLTPLYGVVVIICA